MSSGAVLHVGEAPGRVVQLGGGHAQVKEHPLGTWLRRRPPAAAISPRSAKLPRTRVTRSRQGARAHLPPASMAAWSRSMQMSRPRGQHRRAISREWPARPQGAVHIGALAADVQGPDARLQQHGGVWVYSIGAHAARLLPARGPGRPWRRPCRRLSSIRLLPLRPRSEASQISGKGVEAPRWWRSSSAPRAPAGWRGSAPGPWPSGSHSTALAYSSVSARASV